MTVDNVKATVKRHRPAAYIGIVAGVVMVAGWFGYDAAMTPAEPAVQTAPAAQIVDYVIDPRGLNRRTDVEQQKFLEQWKSRLADGDKKNELKDAIKQLSDERRKEFTEAIFKHLKHAFVDEAKTFASLSSQSEKSDFCRRKVDSFAGQSAFLKELAVVFRNDFQGPDQFQEWVLRQTTPAERQLCEPYIDSLKRVSMQMKKEARSATTAKG